MYLANGTTHEAPCQVVFSSPLLLTSVFVQTLCSAHRCNSLSDLSPDFSFLREVDKAPLTA